jgi:hypothetical protein
LALAQQRADEAWAQQIHIYIVFFNRDNNQTAAANVKSLTRGKGDFVQTNSAKELPVLLEEVAKKLPLTLLK